jgi:hypothetical protein
MNTGGHKTDKQINKRDEKFNIEKIREFFIFLAENITAADAAKGINA